ncbi:hypothetical protein A6M27_12905 [Acidithiobacillus thiooxidans]|uniref:Uncharacterized protein n=2 Tax=Acidithiobacillus thiooxidans TaxID=930 RepID=A0A1C2IA77_ACITH|nr:MULTISPECIES: hypothetical protein [Acidithiobacillus]MDA8175704.1 hypothetical protein [Acidithiobacillus sp.]OCX68208.1 hypothetical protein A6O24_19945 [Acidithiobacillus thiooxidans]OCX72901.1 hypothetical protein A6M23_08945 [Acidithiobacillus thiooxidans]OCX73992.1 hypothetical protein A6P07_06860 [Acidithiobacillus thiooxidans]OCX81117.1 hypothetical protein A6P08_14570 [Acidithiobacillus thiooxidans]
MEKIPSRYGCRRCNFGMNVPGNEWCPYCGFNYWGEGVQPRNGDGDSEIRVFEKVWIMKIREKLIRAGVRNLKEFGYSNVNPDNILTDTVFAAFFKSMLEDNLGNGDAADRIIHGLIAEIDKV